MLPSREAVPEVPAATQAPDPATAPGHDVDRRGFLRCMAWAGTGMLWTVSGGIPTSAPLEATTSAPRTLAFVQISDSHIGFTKAANADVTATMRSAIAKIDALAVRPAFLLHTGDISQLAKPSEFDTADQVLRESRTKDVLFVPGEHDVAGDHGAAYVERYAKRATSTRTGGAWYSFDHGGVHFIGLVNVMDLKAGGLGSLGETQLAWLAKDVRHLTASTPIVVFAHVPLWSVYPEWGWGTEDGARALAQLRRFGSVTVLNGHIHQTMQKVEGNVAFHTAMSTAFPQPRPGTAPAPGPLVVPAARLGDVLGITQVSYLPHHAHLALVDETLSGGSAAAALAEGEAAARSAASTAGQDTTRRSAGTGQIGIDNFAFTPRRLSVPTGQAITWTNHDDVPHRVESADGRFAPSPVLDTKGSYTLTLARPGTYGYFCSLHPTMTGQVVVG
jgi:3',5'-cyclic-AMP phosphodiesterase